jgi:uncharacterized protein (DUF924 family)
MERAEEILKFWFGAGDSGRQQLWFSADPAFDRACTNGFSGDYERAAGGELDQWMKQPASALALILLLDQFPRNMFRGAARAFATDSKARAMTRHVVAAGFDRALSAPRRAFVYMPLEHSEDLADQHESLRLFRELAQDDPAEAGYVQYSERHMELIARFGRFPHRNQVLGRISTPQELEFLSSGDSHF